MKRFWCAILTTAMVLGMFTGTYADELEGSVQEEVIVQDEEAITEDGVVEDVIADDFTFSQNVAGYEVNLNAPAGVFPVGTSAKVEKASSEQEADTKALASVDISGDETIANTVTFNFEFTDNNGNVVEPQNGEVNISIKLTNELINEIAALEDPEVTVYHIADGAAEKIASTKNTSNVEGVTEDGGATTKSVVNEVSFGAKSFSSYALVVTSHATQDLTAPSFTGFKVSSNSYLPGSGTPLIIQVGAYDAQSGVGEVSLVLKGYNYKQEIAMVLVEASTGVWQASFDGYMYPDYYFVDTVEMSDKNGNTAIYSVNDYGTAALPSFCRSTYIMAGYSQSAITPAFADLRASSYNVKLPDKVTVAFRMRDLAGSKLTSAVIHFVCYDENNEALSSHVVKFSPYSGDYFYGEINIPRTDENIGTLRVESLKIYREDNKNVEYLAAANNLPSGFKTFEIKTYKDSGFTPNFELTSVKFQESSAELTTSAGAKVAVAASVTDRNATSVVIKLVFTNAQGSEISTIITNKVSGTFVGNITIPNYTRTGTYYLTQLLVQDSTGKYYEYGKTDSTTIYNVMRTCYIDVRTDGQWVRDMWGYWYKRADGSYPHNQWELINGRWYLFDYSGYMKTGWQKYNDKWYYLGSSGNMLTGWQKINGKWYLFNEGDDGFMKTGWHKESGKQYYLYGSGEMATGWAKVSGKWYYFGSNGSMRTGWQMVDGYWYYLEDNGAMATGWKKYKDKWYYLTSSGAMATGWAKVSGKWYYLYSDGHMAASSWIGNYYVNASGVWTKTR